MTHLNFFSVTEILHESSRSEFSEKTSAPIFSLSDAGNNTSGPLNRISLLELPLLAIL